MIETQVNEKRYQRIIWSIVAIAITMVFLFPLYWALSQSLRNPIDTFSVSGLGIPFLSFDPVLDNWKDQLSTPEAVNALKNSTIISVGAVCLALALGTPAGYGLARYRFVTPLLTNKDIAVWFLSQRILPPVATVLPFFLVMRSLNLLDTQLALILINATFILPFVVIIMRQTFSELPVEMEEAAMVDGAGPIRAFFLVALPLSVPSLVATGLITFAFSWNEFLFALTLSSRDAVTIPVHMAGAVDTRGVQFWFMGVRAMIAMIPPVIVALIAQKYIVRGLTMGAVKG